MRFRLKLVVLIVTSSIVSTLFLNTYIYNHHTRRKTNEIRLTQQEKVQYLVQENQQIRPAETPIPEVPVETERPSLKTVLDIQKNFDQENENVENMTDEPTEEKLVSIDPSTKDLCPKFPTELIGNLNVESSLKPSLEELDTIAGPNVMDGCFEPTGCEPLQKVAIVIPYKNRYEHMLTLLHHLHPILQRQKIMYCVFLAEQFDDGSFNKARVMNAAFIEITKSWNQHRDHKNRPFDCFVFHDVDMLLENDFNLYVCDIMPRHLSPAIDKFNYTTGYGTKYGGVTAIRREHYIQVNGHSNRFWGWGGEDNDMEERIARQNLTIKSAYPSIGKYKMIQHDHPWWFNPMSGVGSSYRKDFLSSAKARDGTQDKSGLSNMKYSLIHVERNRLWNKLILDIRSLDLERINVRFYKGDSITVNNKPTYQSEIPNKSPKTSARHGAGVSEPCRPTYAHFPLMTVNRTMSFEDKRYTKVFKTLEEAQVACNEMRTSCQSIVEQVRSRFTLRATALLHQNDLHYKLDVAQQVDVYEHHHSMATYVKICEGDPHYTQFFTNPIILPGDTISGPSPRYSTQLYFRIFHQPEAKYILRSEMMSTHKAVMLVRESNKLIKHPWWDSLAKIQYTRTNLVNLSDPDILLQHTIEKTATSTLLLITTPTSGFQRIPGCYIMKQSLYDDITKHVVMEWTWWFRLKGQTEEIENKLLDDQLEKSVKSGKQYEKMINERKKVLEMWAQKKLEEKRKKFIEKRTS
uniref:uncharacterized protein LOC100179116 isoform X1 n=1 Tax=Ciona intestinalis TaxID=7719 RepID=UPI000EF47E78|nr:uncharacterized protein LOC100179116 isoform X1 [Ciona intestinalis]|eukprot:XP_018668614.2 uncharacterized protein LOC100179116 isoform X1 [Ciona intestinalis]